MKCRFFYILLVFQENLRAIQARDQARSEGLQRAQNSERNAILATGGNPDQALLIQKRMEDLQKKEEWVLFFSNLFALTHCIV